MRKFLMLGVCALFVVGCFGAAVKGKSSVEGAKPAKKFCTDEKDSEFKLAIGEQAPSAKGTCMLVKCEDVVDGKSQFTTIGCGVFVPTVGCNTIDYDYTKRYPDCCPSEVCGP